MTISRKISVSLPSARVDFVDRYAAEDPGRTRSSTIAEAVALLEERELESSYAAAYDEWKGSGDRELWEATVADGLAAEELASEEEGKSPLAKHRRSA